MFSESPLQQNVTRKRAALGRTLLRVNGGLPVLALLAFAVGGIAGLVGAVFRLVLEWSDRFRDAFIHWAHGKVRLGGRAMQAIEGVRLDSPSGPDERANPLLAVSSSSPTNAS